MTSPPGDVIIRTTMVQRENAHVGRPPRIEASKRGCPRAIGAAVLLVVTLLAYLPAMRGGFVWDDDALVTDNANLRSFAGLIRTWADPGANRDYYPLTHSSFWLEHRLFGLNPFVFHLDNVLLHAGNAILFWLILRLLAVPGAWVAAALFALHPVHVESVAWISERKNVLSGFFCLLAVWSFLRFSLAGNEASPRRPGIYRGLSLFFFICAMLAKPMTMAVAAVLPLLVWWRRGTLTGDDVRAAGPYFALAAPMAAVTIWVQAALVGAQGESFHLSLGQRVILAGRVPWFYAGKLLWPRELTFAYERWVLDAGAWRDYRHAVGAVAVLVSLFLLRRRLGAGPLVAVLAFVAMLTPALGFFNIFWHRYYFVADHIPYLASMSLIALGVAAAGNAAPAFPRAGGAVRNLAACAVLAVFGVATWRQGGAYKDAETLWRDTIAKNPRSWLAHDNLGAILFEKGRTAESMQHYAQSLAINPANALTYNNLGVWYAQVARTREAEEAYRNALRLRPEYATAHVNLGHLLIEEGRLDEALWHLTRALEISAGPRGAVFDPSGNVPAPRASPADPSRGGGARDQALKHRAIGEAFLKMQRFNEAVAQFQAALRLDADSADAHYDLGLAMFAQGKDDQAAAHFSEAVRLDPGSSEAHNNLGGALARLGRAAEAVRHFREALRIKPDNAAARRNLDRALPAAEAAEGAHLPRPGSPR